jgi:hypothetical protein
VLQFSTIRAFCYVRQRTYCPPNQVSSRSCKFEIHAHLHFPPQTGAIMLIPRHPKPVVDQRPVAVKIIEQKNNGARDKHVLIVEQPKPAPPTLPAK